MISEYPYPDLSRNEVLPFIPSQAESILDVGCGQGGFGSTLRRADAGRVIWGVEPDERAASQAAPHYDRLLVGGFPDALVGHGVSFDCVVFNDVLEHMVDPWSALRHTAQLLSKSGVIVASIPNVRFVRTVLDLVFGGNWTYTDIGVLDRTHLRFFTRRTIIKLFSDEGYHVELVQGINWLGSARSRMSRFIPLLLRDFAYTGFVVRARPSDTAQTGNL
jgi:2-polyprenyl-3-methyl-5-hydroxy-6-metoxy-1,4-benzoquinol methylase